MTVALDLSKRAWTRHTKGLTLIGTWIVNEDDRWRPCMVIIRTGDEYNPAVVPCVVTMDNAWLWDERIGDPRRAAHHAAQFAEALRMEPDVDNMIRLAMIIADHLGDLLTIPPFSPLPGTPIAEVTISERDTGRVMREVELTADV